jgi:hypothetical protein
MLAKGAEQLQEVDDASSDNDGTDTKTNNHDDERDEVMVEDEDGDAMDEDDDAMDEDDDAMDEDDDAMDEDDDSSNGNDKALVLSGYTLIKGNKIGYAYDKTVELHDWMKRVRQTQTSGTEPNATFYFPENDTGPDLVFALKSPLSPSPTQTDRDIVLCVVQASSRNSSRSSKNFLLTLNHS